MTTRDIYRCGGCGAPIVPKYGECLYCGAKIYTMEVMAYDDKVEIFQNGEAIEPGLLFLFVVSCGGEADWTMSMIDGD